MVARKSEGQARDSLLVAPTRTSAMLYLLCYSLLLSWGLWTRSLARCAGALYILTWCFSFFFLLSLYPSQPSQPLPRGRVTLLRYLTNSWCVTLPGAPLPHSRALPHALRCIPPHLPPPRVLRNARQTYNVSIYLLTYDMCSSSLFTSSSSSCATFVCFHWRILCLAST